MTQKIIAFLISILSSQLVVCQITCIKSEVDSIKNIKQIELSCFPSYNLKAEISLDQSDLIIVLYCDSSLSHVVTTNDIPMNCYDELKANKEKNMDSSRTLFNQCIINHFVKDKGKYKIDTIWVNNDWTIQPINITGKLDEIEATYFMSKYELFSKDSSIYSITEFYKMDELKNHCINEMFRYKSQEEWVNGKKHGKWEYWNKNGIKARAVEYEHGKKIKETIF